MYPNYPSYPNMYSNYMNPPKSSNYTTIIVFIILMIILGFVLYYYKNASSKPKPYIDEEVLKFFPNSQFITKKNVVSGTKLTNLNFQEEIKEVKEKQILIKFDLKIYDKNNVTINIGNGVMVINKDTNNIVDFLSIKTGKYLNILDTNNFSIDNNSYIILSNEISIFSNKI